MLQLHFKTYGEGTTNLIILHGFLGSLDNWHTLATEWGKAGLCVWSLDLRNHGKSPHTEEHSLQLMVDDLNDFMFQQQLTSAVILGHSMGGKVAMLFALQYPDLCEKLIVADMAPRAYKPGHDEVFDAIFSLDLETIESRKQAEEIMKQYLGDNATRQFILKNLDRNEKGKYEWKFNLKTLFTFYDEIRKPIESRHTFDKPSLFLRGEQSSYVRDNDMPSIEALFPQVQLVTVDQAAHWLHAEQPKVFFEQVMHFVNS
jgi:esterase